MEFTALLNRLRVKLKMAMLYELNVREFYGRTSLNEGESQFGGAWIRRRHDLKK
jgi:hypothetical protein